MFLIFILHLWLQPHAFAEKGTDALTQAQSDSQTEAPADDGEYEIDYEEEPEAEAEGESEDSAPASKAKKKETGKKEAAKKEAKKNGGGPAVQGSRAKNRFTPILKSETKSVYQKNGKHLDVDSD